MVLLEVDGPQPPHPGRGGQLLPIHCTHGAVTDHAHQGTRHQRKHP